MKSWYTLALGGCILVLALGFQLGRRAHTQSVPPADEARKHNAGLTMSQEVAALKKELAYVQEQLTRVSRPPAHRLSGNGSGDPGTQTQVVQQSAYPQPSDPPTLVEQPPLPTRTEEAQERASNDQLQGERLIETQEREAQERQYIDQLVLHLDDALDREPDGDGWAESVEAGIAEALQTEDWPGSSLAEATCHVTLCRMVVEHEELETARTFVTRMVTLEAFTDTEAFYQQVTREDGTVATVVYIARQGYRLPTIPSP